ncbi:hypothetical protein OUZ56_005556 [Daphnia magna]|uniref:DDE Tnp4 domain-containing protein n=1 Tax=Daphnia magna TaxID=35525 RepID=A0ABQ9YT80_9CRUS|nr:hypothetical protein OUZ56_005556 [Daphnia magna]
MDLIQHLLPKSKIMDTRNLEPIDMLWISLQFYAAGSFQTVVGNVLRYSQSSRSLGVLMEHILVLSDLRTTKKPMEGFLMGDSGYANTYFLITADVEPVTQPEVLLTLDSGYDSTTHISLPDVQSKGLLVS